MPILATIDEIDAALTRAAHIPHDERIDVWHAIVDTLLDQRLHMAGTP